MYLSEGDHTNALLSGVGMIPVIGDAAVVAKRGGKVLDSGIVVDKYSKLKRNKNISGQAHHLNQDAAYRAVIPTKDGMSIKLEGNAFKDIGTPHYEAHKSLEKFWDQYRRGGPKAFEKPTHLEYTKAIVDSMKASGFSKEQSMQIAREAIRQRLDFGLLGGKTVNRVPNKIYQSKN